MEPTDVLVVGAGPTGLTMAAQLDAFGVRCRLVDRSPGPVHESRALAIQPRTLEVLAGLGLSAELVARGNPATKLRLHLPRRIVPIRLYGFGITDTAYPYLLFLSQAETERILNEYLARRGVAVERGVELVDLNQDADGSVTTRLRGVDGRTQVVRARYVVGCDGAHSAVRERCGIEFAGAAYPQTFLLADLEADQLTPEAVHAFLAAAGMLFFFPLGEPATWRMLTMRPDAADRPDDRPDDRAGGRGPGWPDEEVTLAQLQRIVDGYTTQRLRLRDPVWMTPFRLHRRAAVRYRSGSVFLAGDAAHIHSPAGAQGMNTGIQDAVNLGWKLAMVIRGLAAPELLDSYEPERVPVGRAVLRLTDRAFRVATSESRFARFARARLAPAIARYAVRSRHGLAAGFRTIAQLRIGYRDSPAVAEGPHAPRRGPRAGDRVPDAPVVRDGQATTLHAVLGEPAFHLLLCGPPDAWPQPVLERVTGRWPGLVVPHRLTRQEHATALRDPDGAALRRLGLDRTGASPAAYLVRPDGHVGYRCGGTQLDGLLAYLERWLPGSADRTVRVHRPVGR
jgi:2-polyprenyl-6-methoxyphenol hydroxylase-like FAD-dependent oxidoreductase